MAVGAIASYIGMGSSAGGGLYSGIAGYMFSMSEAEMLEEEGALTKTDYFRQAQLEREEGDRIRSKQTMEYVGAGVEVLGTPLLVLEETRTQSRAKAAALETTGINYERLAQKKAKLTEQRGKAGLISGIFFGGK